jgi:predicted nucleic acid-binding protein
VARFIDSNVLLRLLGSPVTVEDRRKAERARDLLLRVERGEEQVITTPLVIFETIFTLNRTYPRSRDHLRDRVSDVLSLRGLQLPGKGLFLEALQLFAATNVSFADAFNAVTMQARGVSEIYSWDTDFDRLPGITRVEP